MNPTPYVFRITACILLGASTLFAREIPDPLPKCDGKPPDKSKPVKVYILAGQSNMVGMGTINPINRTSFKTYVTADKKSPLGCTLSIYSGKYDIATDYSKQTPVETHVVKMGAYPHTNFPEIAGDYTHIVRGFIRIDVAGRYEFSSPGGPSSLRVDGEEIYSHKPGEDPVKLAKKLMPGAYPLEIVFYGRGATNLSYSWTDTPGTLVTMCADAERYGHLLADDGSWAVRNDVMYEGLVSAIGKGPLSPLVSTNGKDGGTIGPELGFGHVMGYYHDEPVLIIKTSQGNRSLAWDFLPPGSMRQTLDGVTYAGYMDSQDKWPEGGAPQPSGWYAGKQYDECFGAAKAVLDSFPNGYPEYAGQGYEVAGFVWWQGHKDSLNKGHAAMYEQNLVHLIKQLRQDFSAPNAPFVVATIGFHGNEMPDQYKPVFDAQMAVSGDNGKYPEFAGNVLTVDTRPFWRSVEQSPQGQDYHYNRNAETYYLVGEAMGRAMAKLRGGK